MLPHEVLQDNSALELDAVLEGQRVPQEMQYHVAAVLPQAAAQAAMMLPFKSFGSQMQQQPAGYNCKIERLSRKPSGGSFKFAAPSKKKATARGHRASTRRQKAYPVDEEPEEEGGNGFIYFIIGTIVVLGGSYLVHKYWWTAGDKSKKGGDDKGGDKGKSGDDKATDKGKSAEEKKS